MPGPFGGHCQTSRPAPVDADRLDELGALAAVGEVLFRLHAAGRLERRGHVGRDRPGIEGVRAARGDRAQRAAERLLDEEVAFPWRAAAGEEELVSGAAQLLDLQRPVPRDARVHRKALFGAADRRLQQFVEALGAVGVQQQLPAGDGARNGDGVRRDVVARGGTQSLDRVDRGRRGRTGRSR